MTIFVDDAFIPARPTGYRGPGTPKWSHLVSDQADPAELHAFAALLGLRRSWFQSKPGLPWHDHYDVTMTVRAAAIRHGAEVITWRELADVLERKRLAWPAGVAPAAASPPPAGAPPPRAAPASGAASQPAFPGWSGS